MRPNAVTYMMHIELFVYLRPTEFGEVLGHSVLTDRVHLVVITIVQMRLYDGLVYLFDVHEVYVVEY